MLRKFIVAIILSVVLLFGIFNGIRDKAHWNFNAKSWWSDGMEKEQIKGDTHGGETPQETLDLFVEALENRDFELASKYFVLDKQEEEREALVRILDLGNIDIMIVDLKRARLSQGVNSVSGEMRFVVDYEERSDFPIDFKINTHGLWKIEEL